MLLSVEDNGPGITPDKLDDLFQAFKSGRSGMGIGLAISRTIAQSHGGDLLVDPGGDGRGARFVVRLPLGPAPATLPEAEPAGLSPAK